MRSTEKFQSVGFLAELLAIVEEIRRKVIVIFAFPDAPLSPKFFCFVFLRQ
jgi:hypothetical protein